MKDRKIWIILLGISLFLFFLDKTGKTAFLYRWLFSHQKKPVSLPENNQPQKSREVLELELARCQEKNQALRRLLEAKLSPQIQFVPATLLGAGKEKFSLSVGSQQGVKKGAWVVWENFLVGKITKVFPTTSEGVFVSSKDFQMAVSIWRPPQEGINKLLVGKGILDNRPLLTVKEILPDEEVKEGDLVAGLEHNGEFLIGKIKSVSWDEGKVFKKAEINWLVNPRQLVTVFVVK